MVAGTLESGPCQICEDRAADYNGFKHQLFVKDKDATLARVASLKMSMGFRAGSSGDYPSERHSDK